MAYIHIVLAVYAHAINQKKTLMRKTKTSENPVFTFRAFLLKAPRHNAAALSIRSYHQKIGN